MIVMTVRESVRALARHKLRSSLSVLGVSIGVAAVICTVAIGNAGAIALREQLQNLGDNLVWVEAGSRTRDGVRLGSHATKTLTPDDAEAIISSIPLIRSVSPQTDARAQLIYGGKNWQTGIKGVTAEYFDIRHWTIAAGGSFSELDVERAENVCVLGSTVAQNLFGEEDPVGKSVRVRHLVCLVTGVMQSKGQSVTGQDQDDQIFMPYTTVMRKLLGVSWLNDIQCSAIAPDLVGLAAQQVSALLHQRHHLGPEDEDDFNIRHPEDVINAQLAASRTFAYWMACVAAVSLLVGGIGIMNIMLVAVTERTREIGLRMAVGARQLHIRLQFLGESVCLSLLGGGMGILGGVGGAELLGRAKQWQTQISPDAILMASLFAMGVGVLFGYYPAYRAARLDPIEALRQE
jgi:putative ABC transport system permease protein